MGNLPITVADIGIVIVLLLSALLAFARGFVHELLSVGAWVAAIVVVIFGLPYLRPFARDLISVPLLADALAGTVLFVISLFLFSMVTRAVAERVHDSALNAVDRSLGAVFGLLRGAVLVCLAYLPVQWLMPPPEQPAWLRDARAMPLITEGAEWIKGFVQRDDRRLDNGSLSERLRRDLESERMARDIMSPEPKVPAQDDRRRPAYSDKDRRELERLLDNSR